MFCDAPQQENPLKKQIHIFCANMMSIKCDKIKLFHGQTKNLQITLVSEHIQWGTRQQDQSAFQVGIYQ